MKTSINTGGEFYLVDFGYFSMSVYTFWDILKEYSGIEIIKEYVRMMPTEQLTSIMKKVDAVIDLAVL